MRAEAARCGRSCAKAWWHGGEGLRSATSCSCLAQERNVFFKTHTIDHCVSETLNVSIMYDFNGHQLAKSFHEALKSYHIKQQWLLIFCFSEVRMFVIVLNLGLQTRLCE